jgi:hypothetical protein
MQTFKHFLLEDLTDPVKVLNMLADKWITTHYSERNTFPHAYITQLMKDFPDAVYTGSAFRIVNVDGAAIDKAIYVKRPKQPSDLTSAKEKLDKLSGEEAWTSDIGSVVQYWDDIKTFLDLIPNGNRIAQNMMKKQIHDNTSGKYVSWSKTEAGLDQFESLVMHANRMAPIQFQGDTSVWPLVIKATVTGLDLSALADKITDKQKSAEVAKTLEVIALTPTNYTVLGYKDAGRWVLPTFSDSWE